MPVIMINHMFTGDYLDDNIGHEIINLFQTDDNQNYIYLCKDGRYTRDELPQYVVQVRHHGTRMLEIINIARIERKVDVIEIPAIRYGEVSLIDIFESNKEQGTDTYATFKASEVIKPRAGLHKFITYEGNRPKVSGASHNLYSEIHLEEKRSDGKYRFDVGETLRNYIIPSSNTDSDYVKLQNLIDEAFCSEEWEVVVEHVTALEEGEDYITPGDIYGIENLELPYSNAFSFFIRRYPELLTGFCAHLLIEDNDNEDLSALHLYLSSHPDAKLTVYREWKNIDILIRVDDEWIIVVENKIFSDLNGRKGKEITQLDKYHKLISESRMRGKKLFVLLTPDHNDIDITRYHAWRKIHYSKVYQYLSGVNAVDEHLKGFTEMIRRHSNQDYNYGVMKRRFEKVLRKKSNILI